MRKVTKAIAFIVIILMSVMLTIPAYGAVPYHSRYRTWPGYWFGWPIPNRIRVPSLPWDSKPVQAPAPDASRPGNSDTGSETRNLNRDENYILKQVNSERAKAGLKPLEIDYRLVQTARAKSADMIKGGYFSHQSPTLGSPFDQMKKAGITYRYAGENIAGNPSAAGAMTSWMNSAGHRANILNPNFTRIGIGVVDGGTYGKMLTQQFIG